MHANFYTFMTSGSLPVHIPENNSIIIQGAKVNNLKNLSVSIPRNRLIVITGLSGSGKSSLAFDTLYAEGQRRYVESLSSYARQFLGKMNKPEVDFIKGISPAIAIEQKVNTRNPRSTVGTSTEIYEYVKLLFARVGKTYSPVSGQIVKRNSVADVLNYILLAPPDSRISILAPAKHQQNGRNFKTHLTVLLQQGFTRVEANRQIYRIEDLLTSSANFDFPEWYLLVDRISVSTGNNSEGRIADSVETAFFEGGGFCVVEASLDNHSERKVFSSRFEADGITFEEPSSNFFSFNNPYGACQRCEGFGSIIGIDEELVIPDKSLSIFDDAIACWRGEKMSEWKNQLIQNAFQFSFPIHRPWYLLDNEQRNLVWTGNEYFGGLNAFFEMVEANNYKVQYRVMMSRYRGKTVCPDCNGTRLRKDAAFVKIAGTSICDVVLMQVKDALLFFQNLTLDANEMHVAKRLLVEITNRLRCLCNVGLGYLTLNRLSNTLSGGESQRINLATSLGSSLVGSTYILDEPSIGLHPRDTQQLLMVLKQLRDLGNTVIVVEHDEEVIRTADQIIDIGPKAGEHGGEIVFQGSYEELILHGQSLTGQYLSGLHFIEMPARRMRWKEYIEVIGAREHNLKNLTVRFPLQVLTAVTGVSGSGKTSLVKDILYAALKKIHGGAVEKSGRYDKLAGDFHSINSVELIDQNPIGRSSRSNPATYVKAWDDIRLLFADLPLSLQRGYKPGYFSFNIAGGRCEQCEGEGMIHIGMQFMADIALVCDECNGKRFKNEVLDVALLGKNIADILNMSIDHALDFFSQKEILSAATKRITARLMPLSDVGLGYLRLGQSSSTLSGGEAQRIKLAFFLSKGQSELPTLFIFDEPTTGLHFHDINKLMKAFSALLQQRHTIIVIEHNMEVIKCADWIIDLGPDGGEAGGYIVAQGTPEEVVASSESHTAKFLAQKLSKQKSVVLHL